MNKQTYAILSVTIVAVIAGTLAFAVDTDQPAKETIILDGALPDYPASYLAEETEYAIMGMVTKVEHLPVQYNSIGSPYLFTDVTIAVVKDLKGLYAEDIITVRTLGGESDEYVMISEGSPEFTVGEEVFIFVGSKETGTIYGDNYYVAGLQYGKFNLDVDGQAINKEPRKNLGEDELIALVKAAQENGN